jgi:hypothetical protein
MDSRGLVSDIAINRLRSTIEIVGVQINVYPSMVRALAGEYVARPDGVTIAEGNRAGRHGSRACHRLS